MILFKELKWSNFFSYGEDNSINLEDSPVTQLVGLNGTGKTSIPIILQEVLYGKNIKKIVKSDLTNRNIPKCTASASITFTVDNIPYKVEYNRKSSKIELTLFMKGENISSHTTQGTLKNIESIIGLDFDTFSQLVYQSSKASLQFLTATDTQRKKFLISLFSLDEYLAIQDKLKAKLNEVVKDKARIEGNMEVYARWLLDNKTIPQYLLEKTVPDVPNELHSKLLDLEVKKSNLEQENKRIEANNSYKEQLSSIDKTLVGKSIADISELSNLRKKYIELKTLKAENDKLITKLGSKKNKCPTCGHSIDISDSLASLEKAKVFSVEIGKDLLDINNRIAELSELEAKNKLISKATAQFEELSNLIEDLPESITTSNELNNLIAEIKEEIASVEKRIRESTKFNETVRIHNAKIDSIKEQTADYKIKVEETKKQLTRVEDNIATLTVLKDAFGTNGLVSFKLEYLTKDLELIINEYLQELSRGRFQITFIMKGDKLNIEVLDQGEKITINSLSEGEQAKVTVSTVLAIRKLMQSLSKTKLNILFLDEIMSVLDDFGREDLISVLLKEVSLNTFLVTHAYKHPLVPIINIVQENEVSKIETV